MIAQTESMIEEATRLKIIEKLDNGNYSLTKPFVNYINKRVKAEGNALTIFDFETTVDYVLRFLTPNQIAMVTSQQSPEVVKIVMAYLLDPPR